MCPTVLGDELQTISHVYYLIFRSSNILYSLHCLEYVSPICLFLPVISWFNQKKNNKKNRGGGEKPLQMFMQGNWSRRMWRTEESNSGQRLAIAGNHYPHWCLETEPREKASFWSPRCQFLWQNLEPPEAWPSGARTTEGMELLLAKPLGAEKWERNILASTFPLPLLQPLSPIDQFQAESQLTGHPPGTRSHTEEVWGYRGPGSTHPANASVLGLPASLIFPSQNHATHFS